MVLPSRRSVINSILPASVCVRSRKKRSVACVTAAVANYYNNTWVNNPIHIQTPFPQPERGFLFLHVKSKDMVCVKTRHYLIYLADEDFSAIKRHSTFSCTGPDLYLFWLYQAFSGN